MNSKFTFLFLGIFINSFTSYSQAFHSLMVNEIMASNDTSIADNTGEFPDWIEIYNPGTQAINIAGYYISDNPNQPLKHQMSTTSAIIIPAGGFIVLWASGEPSRGSLHLDFALSASGESVLITGPDGVSLIDSLTFGVQRTDISLGRTTDGAAGFSFFMDVTPGASNNTAAAFQGFLSPPIFSAPSGFYAANFNLTLSANPSDAAIYYSLDGTEPNPSSVAGITYPFKNIYPRLPGQGLGPMLTDSVKSFEYTAPLSITDATLNPNRLSAKNTSAEDVFPADYLPTQLVRKGTVVKARAFKPGFIPSEIVTNTYFITSNGQNPYTLPLINISTQENNLFDYYDGVYTAGIDFDNWRIDNPSENTTSGRPANWQRASEFPVSFEFFEASATERTLFRNAGFRVHGGFSSARPRKSFRIYFKNSYGYGDLDFPGTR